MVTGSVACGATLRLRSSTTPLSIVAVPGVPAGSATLLSLNHDGGVRLAHAIGEPGDDWLLRARVKVVEEPPETVAERP
jgi:hypothetical protein